MNNKKIVVMTTLLLAIILLGVGTISYFRRAVNGNITGQTGNLVLIVNEVDGAQNGSFSISLNRSEIEPFVLPDDKGSFDINIDSTGSTSDVELIVSITRTNLPDNLKFYLDEKYTKELTTKSFPIEKADTMTKSLKIYWFWDGSVDDINDSLYMGETLSANISVSAQKFEYGKMMDWFDLLAQLRNLGFSLAELTYTDDFSILPEECTEENFCMNISHDANQKFPVYAYVSPTGEVNEDSMPLVNIYIVSEGLIMAPSDSSYFFAENQNLKTINFNDTFSTAFVTNMSFMFAGCPNLTNLNLSSFDTSSVTDMIGMFGGCSNLTSLNLSSFDTSNVPIMMSMFEGCSNLISLDLSSFDTSNVHSMHSMFYGCSSLTTTITISGNVTSYTYMFADAATNEGAKITVNYTSSTNALVDDMIATKSDNSNVVKGSLVS